MRTIFRRAVVYLLKVEAQQVLRKYRPHIIAVTGSVGKTSTKDAIFSVLSNSRHVRKSDKSFNSEIGLPLTILGRPNAWNNPLLWLQNLLDGLFLILLPARYPKWLVLEVGADRPGDIRSLASWLPVDVAIITRLPEVPVHVEFFDSPEAVVEEKASLINALKPDGVLVIYGDDARAPMLTERAKQRGLHVISYGTSAGVDVRSSDCMLALESGEHSLPIGMQAQLTIDGTTAPITALGVAGAHALLSLTAAAAVGKALGMNLAEIVAGVTRYEPPKGRMRLLPGVKDTLVIDDTYNSSPAAVVAALDTFAFFPKSLRKIAVLGDMLELGRYSVEEHKKIGAHVAKTVDFLVTVGFRARDIAQGALDNGLADSAILQFEDSEKAGDELEALLAAGDCVLVKGSQSIRMERVVEHIMREPERAPELLVRQERDWKRR